MQHIILYQPQIPQNTGNIGRLCAYTGARLHLVHPLGFRITDRHLKRSGMDYWNVLDVRHYENWHAYMVEDVANRPPLENTWLLTTKAQKTIWDSGFQEGDGLLFGNEGHGLPDEIHQLLWSRRICIPQFREGLRSLNLSTSAGIALYESLRQCRATGKNEF